MRNGLGASGWYFRSSSRPVGPTGYADNQSAGNSQFRDDFDARVERNDAIPSSSKAQSTQGYVGSALGQVQRIVHPNKRQSCFVYCAAAESYCVAQIPDLGTPGSRRVKAWYVGGGIRTGKLVVVEEVVHRNQADVGVGVYSATGFVVPQSL